MKGCCSGGKPGKVERELLERLRHLHSAAIGNEELAFEHIRLEDDGVTRSIRTYCSECGLVDKPNKLQRRHCAATSLGKGKCHGTPVRGHVLSNKFKQLVPESFVHAIIANNSPLRRRGFIINPPPTPTPMTQQVATAAVATAAPTSPPVAAAIIQNSSTSTYGTTPSSDTATPSSEPQPKRIKVTPTQLDMALNHQLQSSPTHRQEQINNQIESLNIPHAKDHLWFLQHLCLGSGMLRDTLLKHVRDQQLKYSPESDDLYLKALLRAGDLWFTTQSANIDVREISTHMRADLFKVGSNASDDDADLIWGKTFVPTFEHEYVRREVKHLLMFLYRGHHVEEDLTTALSTIVDNIPYDDVHADQWTDNVAVRILVTDLIPAVILNALLEEPKVSNGPTIFHDYIAARSFNWSSGDTLNLNSMNHISKSANALLRVVRHAACTHFNFLSAEYQTDHRRWTKEATEMIQRIQSAKAMGHICLRIRTARDAQGKESSSRKKRVDIATGDIYVDGSTIHYEQWCQAIPKAIALVKDSLALLFQNSSALNKWLDLNNTVAGNGHQYTCLHVATDLVETMETIDPHRDLAPALGQQADDDIQKAIARCFEFEKFAFAYSGVGGARGTDLVNMPEYPDMLFVFNTLMYDLTSLKGVSHGRCSNKSVEHYLPPSISRIVVLLNLVLWPAVKQSDVFKMPDKSTSHDAADRFFPKVFGLQQSLGPGANRQVLASMHNLILPSSETKVAVHPLLALKFQHTAETHRRHYADDICIREGDNIIGHDLLVARVVHRHMGEIAPLPSLSNDQQLELPSTVDEYTFTARFLYGPMSSVPPQQLEAIQHLDSTSARGQKHCFVFMAPGTGKSGLYNISLAAAALYGKKVQKTLVISPHNGLLVQHTQQSIQYFNTLPIKVICYESSDISENSEDPPDMGNVNLCFLSICAFKKLIRHHPNSFEQWKFKRIIIDEYHNVISEVFRFNSSWEGLRNIALLKTKVVCMSATANTFIMKCISQLLGLGNEYKVIGDTTSYCPPNVAILLSSVNFANLTTTVIDSVSCDFDKDDSRHSAHVITLTIADANKIADQLNERGIKSRSLHSECTREERQDIMFKWSQNQIQALVSTIQDGIDSITCKRVYIAGGSQNNMALIQSIGRIRPPQQTGQDATVKIFDTKYPKIDENHDEETSIFISKVTGAGIVGEEDHVQAATTLVDLFQRSGYKQFIHTKECLRQELLRKIGVSSDRCQMCTNCLGKNDILRTATAAAEQKKAEEERKHEVFEYLKQMTQTCKICDSSNCSGGGRGSCLPNGSCFSCHKKRQYCSNKNTCTLKREKLFQSEGNRHQFCTWCFAPKTLEFQNAMGNNVHHRGDIIDERTMKTCTLGERPKRLLLRDQTDDSKNTTVFMSSVFVCETSYYNFFHEQMTAWKEEQEISYMKGLTY